MKNKLLMILGAVLVLGQVSVAKATEAQIFMGVEQGQEVIGRSARSEKEIKFGIPLGGLDSSINIGRGKSAFKNIGKSIESPTLRTTANPENSLNLSFERALPESILTGRLPPFDVPVLKLDLAPIKFVAAAPVVTRVNCCYRQPAPCCTVTWCAPYPSYYYPYYNGFYYNVY